MRRVVGYIDGQPQWSENVPASTGSSRLGGELVSGAHGWVEQGRINARAARRDTPPRGEKLVQRLADKSARFVAGKDKA